MMTFLEPLVTRKPMPRITPDEPMPMRELLGADSLVAVR
jgi:hypothetical protein